MAILSNEIFVVKAVDHILSVSRYLLLVLVCNGILFLIEFMFTMDIIIPRKLANVFGWYMKINARMVSTGVWEVTSHICREFKLHKILTLPLLVLTANQTTS